MRPPGVRDRVHAVIAEQQALVEVDEHRAARARTELFSQMCGRLGFGIVTARMVLKAYRNAPAPTPSPDASDFAARLRLCVDEVGTALRTMAHRSEDKIGQVLVSIPPPVVLGAAGPDGSFHLVCVTAAQCTGRCRDSYLAARACANMKILRPAQDYGVTAIGERLAIRYEDEPEHRDAIDAEIRDELRRHLSAVPFDI